MTPHGENEFIVGTDSVDHDSITLFKLTDCIVRGIAMEDAKEGEPCKVKLPVLGDHIEYFYRVKK